MSSMDYVSNSSPSSLIMTLDFETFYQFFEQLVGHFYFFCPFFSFPFLSALFQLLYEAGFLCFSFLLLLLCFGFLFFLGSVLRSNPGKKEEYLLQRTLHDMNISKLVADDVPLLNALIADLFSSSLDERTQHDMIENLIRDAVEKMGLVHHSEWVEKVIQLYETSLVRHGIMVIGPPGSGKTTVFDVMLRVLSLCPDPTTGQKRPYRSYRMNPKAITDKQVCFLECIPHFLTVALYK